MASGERPNNITNATDRFTGHSVYPTLPGPGRSYSVNANWHPLFAPYTHTSTGGREKLRSLGIKPVDPFK